MAECRENLQGACDTAAQTGQGRRNPHLQVAGSEEDGPQGGGGMAVRAHRCSWYRLPGVQDSGLPYTIAAMSNQTADRYEAEAKRLARVLATIAREKRASVRSLERKMKVGESVFSKVLRGTVTLQVRHVLMIADALEIGWSELFARAYGYAPTPPPRLAPAVSDEEADRRIIRLLLRLGVIDEEKAREAMV
jgi:transcriptional regulator with XRE-family HTH domain